MYIFPPFADSTTGRYKVWQVRTSPFSKIKDFDGSREPCDLRSKFPAYFNFAEFTLTEKDAKEYKYSKGAKQRVHKWKDIKVKLYI